jgi:tetratricopeptide (TPR) repeat protein
MRIADLLAPARSPRKVSIVFALALAGLAASCSKDQAETPEQHLTKANAAYEKGQLLAAEQQYREVLRLAPSDAVAQRQLGSLYFEQGQIRQALPLLKRAADAEADNWELKTKLVRNYLVGSEFQLARDLAQQIVEKQPGQDEAMMLLADAGIRLNQVEDTRKFLDGIREEDKQRAGYHAAQGMLLLAQRQDSEAENEFNAATKADPKFAPAHAGLAAIYWGRKDLKGAEQEFRVSAELSPKRSPLRLQLPDFLIRTGQLAEAKTILDGISSQFPDYLPVRVYQMRIACGEKQDDNCKERVAAILKQDPANFDALLQDGVFKLASGDVNTAAREFTFLSGNYAQNPQVIFQLARANLLQARVANPVESKKALDSAETNLTEAIKLNPNFEPALLALAELKIRKGSPAAAIDLLQPLVQQKPQNPQAYYLLAAAYVAQRNPAEAIAIYQRMIELFPSSAEPRFLLATIQLAQGNRAEAYAGLEKTSEIDPNYLPATERLLDLDLADKQAAKATSRIQTYLDKNPNSAQGMAIRAKVHLAQQDNAGAEADLVKSIELDPKLEGSYLLLAQLYLSTNRAQQAVDKLQQYTKDNTSVAALMELAMIEQQQKHFPEARDAYEKVVNAAPNSALALNNLAALYSEQFGQTDKAYDLAKRAKDAAPNEAHIADTLGWITFKKGDYRNALPLLKEGAAKLPDNPEIQYHLGLTQYMLGDEEPAKIALQKAAQGAGAFPQKEEAQQRLAILNLDTQGPTETTRATLDSFLKQQPRDPAALTRLARLQERDGSADQAVETYRKAVDADPLFAPALRDLTLLYATRSADESKALEVGAKARQAYPDDPELAKTLGILNVKRGLYSQSVELLNQAAGSRRDDAEIQLYLGRSYQELKKWDECKSSLERALALKLSPELSKDAQARLVTCTEQAAQ